MLAENVLVLLEEGKGNRLNLFQRRWLHDYKWYRYSIDER